MPDVRTIVLDLCRRAGLDPDTAVDAAGVAGRVPGLVVANRTTVRGIVEALQRAYPFDVSESDGRLRFRDRGMAPVRALTEADLVPQEGGSLLQVTRQQESELPRQVDVLYASPAADFQTCSQSARRLAGAAASVTTVELPLALDDDRARRIADRLLYESWIERDVYRFGLSAAHADLDPADVVTLAARGREVRLRLLSVETGTATVQVTAVPDDPALHGSTAMAGRPAAKLPEPRALAPTVLFALDLPLLRDEDDGPGWYAAASYDATVPGVAWPGAVLLESVDGGASFETLANLRGPATWGRCEDVLGDGPVTHWDEANTLRVRLSCGNLYSRDAGAVLAGANAALVGAEVVQFRQAALGGDGVVTLSGLLRGRRGTEHRTAGHGPGERLLLLAAHDLIRLRGSQERIGALRRLKAVTLGGHAEDVADESFVNRAAGLGPWSVAHVRGVREGDDWRVSWVRRTRLGGGWIDGADVPLPEQEERYETDILDGGGGVLRTLSSGSPSVLYTSAMQAADFGGPQDALRVRIHQISATVGRGVGREATL